MAVCLRYHEKEELVEKFIGFYEVCETTGRSIANSILDALTRVGLLIEDCRGQYGAAKMSGKLNGAAKHIQDLQSKAVYTHCLSHNLNLCLQSSCRQVRCINDALDIVQQITTFIRASPKRLSQFKLVQKEIGGKNAL